MRIARTLPLRMAWGWPAACKPRVMRGWLVPAASKGSGMHYAWHTTLLGPCAMHAHAFPWEAARAYVQVVCHSLHAVASHAAPACMTAHAELQRRVTLAGSALLGHAASGCCSSKLMSVILILRMCEWRVGVYKGSAAREGVWGSITRKLIWNTFYPRPSVSHLCC
jgi:hypothetical protein